jgi:hypothetical protein
MVRGRLLRLERIPVVHGSGIGRRDADSMLGEFGVKLLRGAVELPQVEDLGSLICGACPWRGEKPGYAEQQARLLKTIRP